MRAGFNSMRVTIKNEGPNNNTRLGPRNKRQGRARDYEDGREGGA